MPYKSYNKLTWEMNGTYYPDDFNRIENGISNLEKYAKYSEMQTRHMAQAMKKLRTGKDFSVAIHGDSIMYGFSTMNDVRRTINKQPGDNNPSEAAKADPTENLTDGLKYLAGNDIGMGNLTQLRTEVQPPHTFMDVMNILFGDNAKITYIDKVMTADCYRTNYYRFNPSGADFVINNLGTNDALASFLPTDYVGVTDEFVHWVTKWIEREIENGSAVIIISPLISTQVVTYDTDGRATLDTYRSILKDIAALYNIPFIDGQEMVTVDGTTRIDFCHYTCAGNSLIGKRMVAPFVSTDMNNPKVIADEDYVGCSVQTDSINVRGNAVLDYSDKSPNPHSLLDSPDLYAATPNLRDMGMCVMVNYDLDTSLQRICDQYARQNCGKQPEEEGYEAAYQAKYDERIAFLKGKHKGDGYVTWSFYCDKENTAVIPAIYLEDPENSEILMELDFATVVPSTAGSFLKEMSLDKLKEYATSQSVSFEDSDTVETLAEKVRLAKFNVAEDVQQKPSNIFNFTGEDTLAWDYVVPMTTTIGKDDVSAAGYYGMNQLAEKKKAVVITTKGWHTISLKASKGKFMAFGLNFLPYREYKRIINV